MTPKKILIIDDDKYDSGPPDTILPLPLMQYQPSA
jgi:hypothetical protein